MFVCDIVVNLDLTWLRVIEILVQVVSIEGRRSCGRPSRLLKGCSLFGLGIAQLYGLFIHWARNPTISSHRGLCKLHLTSVRW